MTVPAAHQASEPSARHRQPRTRSLHCPGAACNGLILGVVPRTARGYLELTCTSCGKATSFALVDPKAVRVCEAASPGG